MTPTAPPPPDRQPPEEQDAAARRRARRRARRAEQKAAAPVPPEPLQLPPSAPSPVPAEILECITAEAENLEALELMLCDCQRFPLGPEAAAEVARLRGLLLSLSAGAAALQVLDLSR